MRLKNNINEMKELIFEDETKISSLEQMNEALTKDVEDYKEKIQ